MMRMPKKALVLAAGLGTRLRPLTETTPKPLMPLWNVPLIEHVLRRLESWGVEEIAVNLHWQPEKIRAYLESRKGTAKIRTSCEPEILGTGGALRPLREFLQDEPFWVMNADIAASVAADPLVTAFEAGDGLAATWLEPKKGPRTVEADRRGRITCYRSPTPCVPGTFTLCGLHLLSPDVFTFLPDRPFCTLVDVYERAMEQNRFVSGVAVSGSYWDDAGTVEAYLRIHGDAKRCAKIHKAGGEFYDARADRRGPDDAPFFCVGAEAAVGADAVGHDCVVSGAARVADGSVLRQSVVTGGSVGGALDDAVCVGAGDVSDDALPRALAALGWPSGETAVVGLGARGSNRTFWRLYRGGETAIYVRYTLERPENLRYSGHAKLLAAAGVPVPAVLADLADVRALVLEDWGDQSLQRLMERRPSRAETWYRPVVAALARLHCEGTREVERTGTALEPRFDDALYAWERRLFEEHLLIKRYGYEALPEEVDRELKGVAERLAAVRQVVVHRDFQSSNILFRGARFAFIDFQGMRYGAAAYDLASLLYDPYVKMGLPLRTCLIAHYGECYPEHREAVERFFDGAVQRLIQALGAYGRLAGLGLPVFTKHILPALENLLEAADECGLEALGGLAEELIARERSRRGG
jgi:NDP-sugar pyrophosphorylase family protein/aminoglycoside/choline kinase family phosphotransferase